MSTYSAESLPPSTPRSLPVVVPVKLTVLAVLGVRLTNGNSTSLTCRWSSSVSRLPDCVVVVVAMEESGCNFLEVVVVSWLSFLVG